MVKIWNSTIFLLFMSGILSLQIIFYSDIEIIIIYHKFFPITAQRERQLIESAIQSFQFLSCLKFKTWDGDPDKDYLHFQNSKARPG